MDWLDLLAVQGTLKSLLQHHSSKASILRHSAFFVVQLSHPYMTTWKTVALTRRTFVGKIVFSNSCPYSQWCYLTISSSATCFSFCLQSFPASESFQMSQLFAAGGQSIGVSASASPSNEYSGLISFRIDWLDLIAVQGSLKSLLQHLSSKASILHHSAFFVVQLSHPYLTTGKTISLTRQTFVGKVMSLLFNMLSRLAIAFLPRSKVKVKVKSLSHVLLFATPWTVTYQALWSMGFSRQEYWSGLPFPSPGVSVF